MHARHIEREAVILKLCKCMNMIWLGTKLAQLFQYMHTIFFYYLI